MNDSSRTPLENAYLLPYSSVRANIDQPREHYDEAALEELRESIRQHGILQPLVVRFQPSRYDGSSHVLIAGERRFRAAEGILDKVPCIVQNVDEMTANEFALIENIQREDLTALEEGKAVRKLMTDHNLSIQKVAERLGVSSGWVTNRTALLKTGKDVQAVAAVKPKAMSALLLVEKVKEPELRSELLAEVQADKPHIEIQARVKAHESAVEAQKKASAFVSKAPDSQTQSRIVARSQGQASNVSRGVRVTGGATKAEAKKEVLRAMGNIDAWADHLSNEDFEKIFKPFLRKWLTGEKAR